MAISKERQNIYRKLRRLGFSTFTEGNYCSLTRWLENAFIENGDNGKEKMCLQDNITIYADRKYVRMSFSTKAITVMLKPGEVFDINKFPGNYTWTQKNRPTVFTKEEMGLIMDLYNEIMKENGIVKNLDCKGCMHDGKWEPELELGYSCPCLRCSRRNTDNYEKKTKR